MNKLQEIRSHLRAGKVYRREQIQAYSKSVDRDLQNMLKLGKLKKLNKGLYYVPKKTVFGDVPPDAKNIVQAFLKDDDFLITSQNNYNSLGLGTTQLYNVLIVYNNKRHGKIKIAGINFDFRLKHNFPKKISKEFLLVDLLNNIKNIAEDSEIIVEKIQKKLFEFDTKKLKRIIKTFGNMNTKKFFQKVLS